MKLHGFPNRKTPRKSHDMSSPARRLLAQRGILAYIPGMTLQVVAPKISAFDGALRRVSRSEETMQGTTVVPNGLETMQGSTVGNKWLRSELL